jgi:hypothetical protein
MGGWVVLIVGSAYLKRDAYILEGNAMFIPKRPCLSLMQNSPMPI